VIDTLPVPPAEGTSDSPAEELPDEPPVADEPLDDTGWLELLSAVPIVQPVPSPAVAGDESKRGGHHQEPPGDPPARAVGRRMSARTCRLIASVLWLAVRAGDAEVGSVAQTARLIARMARKFLVSEVIYG